jgi:hypothetical protein
MMILFRRNRQALKEMRGRLHNPSEVGTERRPRTIPKQRHLLSFLALLFEKKVIFAKLNDSDVASTLYLVMYGFVYIAFFLSFSFGFQFLETGSHYVAQAGLQLMILLL